MTFFAKLLPLNIEALQCLDIAGVQKCPKFSQKNSRKIPYTTPYQVQLACACGYSRPAVESHIACLLSRGAGQMRYKGPQGAVVQRGMTVMAHNGASLARLRPQCLSSRAQKFRQLRGVRSRNANQINDPKN